MITETLRGQIATFGSLEPLGATVQTNGVNFAVHSGASRVSLLLFTNVDDIEPTQVVPMNNTGKVFHVFVEKLKAGAFYLFSADGAYDPLNGDRYHADSQLIDPQARMVSGTKDWVATVVFDDSDAKDPLRHLRIGKVGKTAAPKCVVVDPNFDWQDDTAPNTPLVETVVYEVSVAGMTGGKNSPTQFRGTYKGFIDAIPHLKRLGVTAVELLPIMTWYRATQFVNPTTGEKLENAWGYNTIALGSPDEGLATIRGAECVEFKQLVRALHKAGIEVILDIVPNHSAESHEYGPSISLRGLDNKTYFLLMPGQLDKYLNYSGCGNTMNCNHPVVRKLILDVLRRWVVEYHVDGFRFDLAAILGINCDLTVSADAPVLKEISADPVLRNVKLIAEPWSIGVYLMGQFKAPWSEWCGRYRDTVRAFVRGESGQVAMLGTSLAGSQDWFGNGQNRRLPINVATAHDGFSLFDLVSYDNKHNLANGENGNDGEGHNRSWNCGYEGDLANAPISEDEKRNIDALRRKQVKNFLTLLMVSRGVPMIVYGDEMGRTNGGNNNPWCQLELNQLDWSLLEKYPDLFRFACMIIDFRRRHYLGGRGHQPAFRPLTWHGVTPNQPDWSEGTRLLAVELGQFEADGVDKDQSVFVATNGYWEPIKVALPQGNWYRVVDTNLASGEDIVEDGVATEVAGDYVLQPRSTIVLMRK
jgi:isoamylase